jgi:hypothetical protein
MNARAIVRCKSTAFFANLCRKIDESAAIKKIAAICRNLFQFLDRTD